MTKKEKEEKLELAMNLLEKATMLTHVTNDATLLQVQIECIKSLTERRIWTEQALELIEEVRDEL